jgi:hypothetical protein
MIRSLGGDRARDFTRPNKVSAGVLIVFGVGLVVLGWAYVVGIAWNHLYGPQKEPVLSQRIMRCSPDSTYRPSADSFVGHGLTELQSFRAGL